MMRKVLKTIATLVLLLAFVPFFACVSPSEEVDTLEQTSAPVVISEPVEVAIVQETVVPMTPIPTPTPSPVPTYTPTPEPTPTPIPDHLGIIDSAYLDKFSFDGVIDTEDTYRDETRSITVTKVTDDSRTGRTLTYFIVDIYLQNVKDLRRVQATGTDMKGAKIPITEIAERENTIVSMSGDHSNKDDKIFAVIDGKVIHNSKRFKWDLCVLYNDGTMATYAPDEINTDFIEARGPWITWNFGPSLLDRDGQPKTKFNLPDHIGDRNPRAAIGYYEPGHYCLVLVDGRQDGYSQGLDVDELSVLMYELGCKVAYNLDGGISAQLTWHGKMINRQAKKRNICDIVCISYPTPNE